MGRLLIEHAGLFPTVRCNGRENFCLDAARRLLVRKRAIQPLLEPLQNLLPTDPSDHFFLNTSTQG